MSDSKHTNAIDKVVSNITTSQPTQDLLSAYGLKAHSVTWEDTARTKGSCWGPNISDMTLTVGDRLMPVIRKPNFSDVTDDVPIESFTLNYKGKLVNLADLLKELNVYNERDSVVLTSSQCCVLPVELGKKTDFAVQLFNYQSGIEPAVLVILACKLGTSVQVLDNKNTKLFFDNNGEARWFSAERLEDVRIRKNETKTKVDSFKEMTKEEKLDNSIMMIQVPLLVKQQTRSFMSLGYAADSPYQAMADASPDSDTEDFGAFMENATNNTTRSAKAILKSRQKLAGAAPKPRGMDMGQLGLGAIANPRRYTGTKGHVLKRDPKYPVRCTFQYYRVTDQDTVDEKDIIDIKEQLEQSHRVAVNSGSLVLNPSSDRLTEPVASNQPDVWASFNGNMATFNT
jgi:hypothetical protein